MQLVSVTNAADLLDSNFHLEVHLFCNLSEKAAFIPAMSNAFDMNFIKEI